MTSFSGMGSIGPYLGDFHESALLYSSLDSTSRHLMKKYAYGFSQDYTRALANVSKLKTQEWLTNSTLPTFCRLDFGEIDKGKELLLKVQSWFPEEHTLDGCAFDLEISSDSDREDFLEFVSERSTSFEVRPSYTNLL